MLMVDILIGVLSNVISDDVRRILDDRKYRKALERRIKDLRDRVAHAYGEDGIALLGQAVDCVNKAAFTQEQIVDASLKPANLYEQLSHEACYESAVRSMLPYDQERFSDLCKRVLAFVCRELPRLDSALHLVTAETLRKTDDVNIKMDIVSADMVAVRAGMSRQSEAERQRNEMEAQQILDSIAQHLLVYEFASAYDDAQRLREWLGRRGEEQPGYLAANVYATLAEVDAVRAKNALEQGDPVDLSSARSYLVKARSFGQGHERNRIDALDAYIAYLGEGPDIGLAMLDDKKDAHSIRRRLMILRNAERIPEAATLTRALNMDKEWCEQAAFVLAADGQERSSERLLKWCRSIDDTIIRDRCLLGHARGTYNRLMQKYMGSAVPIPDLSKEDILVLKHIADTVKPIVQVAVARGHIDTQLETWAIEIALLSELHLQNRDACETIATLLASRKPIPVVLARLSLAQQIEPPNGLVERLRDEHPESFEAKLVAAAIERELLHQPEDAFNAAMDLVGQATQPEQRDRLCGLLIDISQDLGDEARAEVSKIAPSLLSDSKQFLKVMEVDSLLRVGQTEQAGKLLEEIRDETDPLWLQMYASFLSQSGDAEKSVEYLLKAADVMDHPDVLWRAAAVSHHMGRLVDAARVLKRYVTIRPRDLSARTNLAMICVDIGDFGTAAQEFADLQKLEPDELSHAFNRAGSLAAQGDTDGASAVLDDALRDKDVPLRFLLQRADLARAAGRPQDGLAILKSLRNQYWDQPEYLMEFTRLGYSAGDELAANEAFARLQQLQSEGRVPPDMLRAVSLDDLVEQIKMHREQAKHIHEEMLRGRASWLMAEEFLGRAPYLGWWIRTQPLDWMGDDPLYRAEHTIYSTNGFTIAEERRQVASLESIECPGADNTVVADLSALITLHRLGLLTAAADYFGKIMIPAAYQLSALPDSGRLVFHQLSTRTALDKIKTMIEANRITPQRGNADERPSIPCVDEYADDNGGDHIYHLRDVIDALHVGGKIQDDKYREFLRVAQKAPRADPEHPEIVMGQEIQVGLSTLRTLSQVGALKEVVDAFSLHISEQDRDATISTLAAIDMQSKVWEWHQELWKLIREDPRFLTVAHFTPSELRRDEQLPERDVCITGFLLARQMGIPLLVDDRMFQLVVLNENRGNRRAAFSTDHLLRALHASDPEKLTVGQLADKLLQLMKWRYKFVVPPPEVLKHFADRFASYPPGEPLQEIAAYAHDCMRDPGLFSGIEPTIPPQTIAFHLYQEWISSIVDFIMEVWADESYETGTSEQITRWALTELLPTLPETFAPWVRARLAEQVRNMVCNRAVLRSITVGDSQRANALVRTIASALGVDPDSSDYSRLMADVIDSTDWTLTGSEDTEMIVRSLVMQSAFLHMKMTGARTATVLQMHGFPAEVKSDHVSDHLISILGDPAHSDRLDLPPGPMIVYRNEGSADSGTATSVVDYLFSPDSRVRRAALSHFEEPTDPEHDVLSGNSKAVIAALKSDIITVDDAKWHSAAVQICDAISEDFLCNLAGVRQELQMGLDSLQFLPKVLHPSVTSLQSLQFPMEKPSQEVESLSRIIGESSERASLHEACDFYYEHLGHLPLAGRSSLVGVVDGWLASHEGEEQIWPQIWGWANATQNPIARYHACSVFAQRPNLVPPEKSSEFWNEILEIVHRSREGTTLKWTQAWALCCLLAKHYESYIECVFPGVDSERSSAASWWIAVRILSALEAVPQSLSFFANVMVEVSRASGAVSSLMHPVVIPSELQYATLHVPSLWLLSLLCVMGPNLQSLDPSRASDEAVVEVGVETTNSILGRFPMHPKPSDAAVYGFELSPVPAAFISAFLPEGSEYRQFLERLMTVEETQESENLGEILRLMPTEVPESQFFIANDLFVRAYTGQLQQETMLEWVSEDNWVQDVLLRLDTNACGILLAVLLEMQAQNEGSWRTRLPHLFAYGCEQAVNDDERMKLFFGATIRSCMISSTVNAISRLLHSRRKHRFLDEVAHWQEHLSVLLRIAPPWIGARIRSMLAILHAG